MTLLHSPKRWASLVALGPISVAVGIIAILLILFSIDTGVFVYLIWGGLSVVSVPLIFVGLWFDIRVVETQTGVSNRRWIWLVLALILAPLVATVYISRRHKWFSTGIR
jgi:hypothetical protein